MSGISLAVGPRPGQRPSDPDILQAGFQNREISRGLMGALRTVQLQLVAIIVVFSASGLVPPFDLLFSILIIAYVLILSRFIFPNYGTKEGAKYQMEIFHGSRMFQLNKALGIVTGLFLPLAHVLGGFARGDQRAVKAVTPHLFLLSVQVLCESVIEELALFSPPVRVLFTLLFSIRRIFTLCDWTFEEFSAASIVGGSTHKDFLWTWFGRSLAVANLIYIILNTFCFLIPRFLPRAFERYRVEEAPSVIGKLMEPTNPVAKMTPFTFKGKEKEEVKTKRQ